MRHRKHTFKIGRKPAHRAAMLANMAASVIKEGQITTTTVRAKEVRRLVERMVTLSKDGSLHARRQAIAALQQNDVVRYLFSELAPRFADRPGGYTRLIKVGHRVGDAADMSILQLVTEPCTRKGDKAPVGAAEATETVEAETVEPAAVAAEEEPKAE